MYLRDFFGKLPIYGKRFPGQKKIRECRYEEELNEKIEKSLDEWVEEKRYLECGKGIEEVAKELGVEKEQLSYYFKSVKHKCFTAWRKSLRIEHAKLLLKNKPELSVSEIGRQCGISDRSDFRKQFREETGETPLKWRKQNL